MMGFVGVDHGAEMGDIVRGEPAGRKQAAKWERKLAGGCLAQADPLYQRCTEPQTATTLITRRLAAEQRAQARPASSPPAK